MKKEKTMIILAAIAASIKKGAVKKVPQEAGCAGRYSLQNYYKRNG